MRPKTVIAAVAVAALAAALVLLLIQVRSPGGEVAGVPAAGDRIEAADAAPVAEPGGELAAQTEPRAAAVVAKSGDDSGDDSDAGRTRIYVRPVPGAQVPDEITADNLGDITVQRDAAPEGSESAQTQAVTRLYRQRRYTEALDGALAVLDDFPDNTGMRRTVVAISCVLRDAELARQHYPKLPETLKRRLRSRCEKYGVELEE